MTIKATIQDQSQEKAAKALSKIIRRIKKQKPSVNALGLLFSDMTLLSLNFAGSIALHVGPDVLLGEHLVAFVLFMALTGIIWFWITPYTGLYNSLNRGSYKFNLWRISLSILLSFGAICLVGFPFFMQLFQVDILAILFKFTLMLVPIHFVVATLSQRKAN